MNKYRLLNILNDLRVEARSSRELSEKYNVSIRSIQRDINELRELGYRIEGYKGQNGYYELIDNISYLKVNKALKLINAILNC